jgi:hypothetical protein
MRAPLRRIAMLLVVLAIGAGAAAGAAYAATKPWKPDYKAARDYAHHRQGQIIAFALRTEHHIWDYNGTSTMPSASVIKAMILTAYLNRGDVRNRDLRSKDYDMLYPMIHQSDDNATDRVFAYVGYKGLNGLAHKVGMTHFKTDGHWGRSSVDADDQSKFLLHIDSFLPKRHRDYALNLMENITSSQRWGVAKVKPPGWHLYFKGGWGRGTGWVDHQVALLRKGSMRIGLAILTYHDPSHDYGKETLRELARRLFRGLDKNSVVE